MIKKKPKLLRPVRPNVGIEAKYRERLQKMIEDMHSSVVYWIGAAVRGNEPEVVRLAGDELPITAIRRALRRMVRTWQEKWNEMAEGLARYFARSVAARSDAALRRTLRDGGWTVKFRLTRAQRDVLGAIVAQNVSLIKSIPQRYLHDVEQLVTRSVTTGRDLHQLTRDIQRRYAVTRDRAKLISKDQNNKATGALTRVRRLELGLEEAIWLHSHAGKKPRPTHVRMHNRRFSIAEGMWDPAEGRHIQPGELINCRCVSRPVIPGFT